MEIATVHVLTALYALAHRLALAPEDAAEVERHAGALTPELWRQSKGLFREADHHGAGSHLDLGFTALILLWLDVPDEDAFAKAFGVRIDEALDRDRGSLGVVAHVIESRSAPGPEELSYGDARLVPACGAVDGQPAGDGARRDRGARARAGSLPVVGRVSPAASRVPGRRERGVRRRGARGARPRAHRGARPRGRGPERRGGRARRHRAILSILWCLAHDRLLLEAERGLDPGIDARPGCGRRCAGRSRRDASRTSPSRSRRSRRGAGVRGLPG